MARHLSRAKEQREREILTASDLSGFASSPPAGNPMGSAWRARAPKTIESGGQLAATNSLHLHRRSGGGRANRQLDKLYIPRSQSCLLDLDSDLDSDSVSNSNSNSDSNLDLDSPDDDDHQMVINIETRRLSQNNIQQGQAQKRPEQVPGG